MKQQDIEKILKSVAAGTLTADAALERLKTLPFEDLGYAAVDHHRTIRQGFPEVIYGEGKTAAQIIGIMANMLPQKASHPGHPHRCRQGQTDQETLSESKILSRLTGAHAHLRQNSPAGQGPDTGDIGRYF